MRRHEVGPRRSQSVDALLRRTRVLAVVALLALAGGIVSDVTEGSFWARHALLAGLTASVIVVMLSVAVINEVLDRRRRERWSILAQFVMLELVRNARLVWTGVLAQVGLLTPDATPARIGRRQPTHRPRHAAPRGRRPRRRSRTTPCRPGLHEEIALLADHTDETLGRWATVMLNADVYAEVIDRHVELAGDIGWLIGLLDNSDPPEDPRRQRRADSSPAVADRRRDRRRHARGPDRRDHAARGRARPTAHSSSRCASSPSNGGKPGSVSGFHGIRSGAARSLRDLYARARASRPSRVGGSKSGTQDRPSVDRRDRAAPSRSRRRARGPRRPAWRPGLGHRRGRFDRRRLGDGQEPPARRSQGNRPSDVDRRREWSRGSR